LWRSWRLCGEGEPGSSLSNPYRDIFNMQWIEQDTEKAGALLLNLLYIKHIAVGVAERATRFSMTPRAPKASTTSSTHVATRTIVIAKGRVVGAVGQELDFRQ
jgi:hypothetical protein